jgi:hypothetical protein
MIERIIEEEIIVIDNANKNLINLLSKKMMNGWRQTNKNNINQEEETIVATATNLDRIINRKKL